MGKHKGQNMEQPIRPVSDVDEFCLWTQEDEGSYTWLTSCKNKFTLDHDSPKQNGMIFCCYCSIKLDEFAWYD